MQDSSSFIFHSKRQSLWFLLLFTALFAIMYPSCLVGWSSGYLGGTRGDAGIYVYIERLNALRFFSWPSEGFDLPEFYPWKRGLAYSDNFLLPSLLAKFLVPLLGSYSVAYNLILVAALILNGYCTFLVALKVTESKPAALFAGFVFMCFPYFAFHRGHPQLQFAFWIPLTLHAVIVFAETRTIRAATLIGAYITGAFFCSVYYAMYAYLLAGVVLMGCFVLRPSTWSLRHVGALIVGNLPWLIVLYVAAIPYMETRHALGTYPMEVLRKQSPSPLAFFAAPRVEQLWSGLTHNLSRMEGFLFFGFVPMVLGLCTVFSFIKSVPNTAESSRLRRLFRWATYVMAIAVVIGILRGTYFSLHPGSRTQHHLAWVWSETLWVVLAWSFLSLVCLSRRTSELRLSRFEKESLCVWLAVLALFTTLGIHDGGKVKSVAPEIYRFIMMLPGYDALRGLSRFGVVAVLAFVILAASFVARLSQNRASLRGARAWGLVGVLLLLSGFELHTRPESLPTLNEPPPVYKRLRELPTKDAIVALPMRSIAKDGRNYMFWNSIYVQWLEDVENPVVNGFSGKVPLFHSLLSHELDAFPSRRALSYLAELVGTHYVIVNSQFYGMPSAVRIREEAKRLRKEIKILRCDKVGNCLYRVNPILDTRELPDTELLIPPDTRARSLTFEVQPTEPCSQGPCVIHLQVDIAGVRTVSKEARTLQPEAVWQPMTVELPASEEMVAPTYVRVKVTGVSGVLLRNSRISDGMQLEK